MYVVNPLSSIKFYLKAGISYNFSPNSDDNPVNETSKGTTVTVRNGNPPVQSNFQDGGTVVQLKKSYLTPLFGIGTTFSRSTLEFSYYLPADIGGQPIGLQGTPSQSFNISSMSLSYYFSVFKIK
jgi:hypothetical protein